MPASGSPASPRNSSPIRSMSSRACGFSAARASRSRRRASCSDRSPTWISPAMAISGGRSGRTFRARCSTAALPTSPIEVVAGARPESEGDRVATEFHAGWYALRFLGDPTRAEPHFRELHTLATLPRTQARASYWLGRTHEAEGRDVAARLDYVEAARFGGTFYGQLSRAEARADHDRARADAAALGARPRCDSPIATWSRSCGCSPPPATPSFPCRFSATLGESVDTPGEVALLSDAGAPSRAAAGRHRRRGRRRGARPEGRLPAGALLRRAGGASPARRRRPRARLRHRSPGERVRPHRGQPRRRARLDAADAGNSAGNGAQRPDPLFRTAASSPTRSTTPRSAPIIWASCSAG